MNLPVEVVEAIEQDRCVLFVGSRFAGEAAEEQSVDWPDDKEVAKALGWKRPRARPGTRAKASKPSPRSVGKAFLAANGRPAYVAALSELLGGAALSPEDWHRSALAHFPLVFTTGRDELLEAAMAADESLAHEVRDRGEPVAPPDAEHPVLYRLNGAFSRPDSLILPGEPRAEFPDDVRKAVRKLIRGHVVLFVGYRPDHEEFEELWDDLTRCYGGELPRCHLAVAQGQIDDVLWQKWVWRGLLMFTADPSECMGEIARRVAAREAE